jgi:hypothetical protein
MIVLQSVVQACIANDATLIKDKTSFAKLPEEFV